MEAYGIDVSFKTAVVRRAMVLQYMPTDRGENRDEHLVSSAQITDALQNVLQPIKEWTLSVHNIELNATDINVAEWLTQRRKTYKPVGSGGVRSMRLEGDDIRARPWQRCPGPDWFDGAKERSWGGE